MGDGIRVLFTCEWMGYARCGRWMGLPKVPPFLFDSFRTTPSISGPARRVPRNEATNEDRVVRPTAVTEKLYGGAEKIWDSVMEMPTSQEMHVVNNSVAQRTAGERRRKNGRTSVSKYETWFT